MGHASSQKRARRNAAIAVGTTARPKPLFEAITSGDRTVRVVGSDRRSRIVRPCMLCADFAELKLGHVAPRWAALWTKNEGYVSGSYRSLGVETRTQDYPKHYMFCADCEQLLGEAENYVSRITRGTSDDLKLVGVSLSLQGDFPRLSGVDEVLVLRAIAGIALKAHLAPHQLYKRTNLSRAEANQLRKAIQSDIYPASRFALYAQKLFNRTVPGANPRASLFISQVRRHGGVATHVFMAGMVWSLFLGPSERWRADFTKDLPSFLFLGSERNWFINPGEWIVDPHVASNPPIEWDDLIPVRKLLQTEPCPCGLDRDFQSCCSGRWLVADQEWFDLDPARVGRDRPMATDLSSARGVATCRG